MDDRQEKILNTIIQEHVKTSEPVGSKAIVDKYDLGISPASVRSEMGHLEKEGYIFQPHISAGRVPTDKGYRFYIHSLQEKEPSIPEREQKALKKKMSSFSDVDKTVKMTTQLLSELTHCASLATLSSTDIYYYGMANIMRQPEFTERSNVLGLADLFDHLTELLAELPNKEEEIVYIGKENPHLKKAECSIIIAPYQMKEKEGVLGVIGPTRMSYRRNISLLAFVTSSLEEF